MRITSEERLDDGVLEREFTLGGIPGMLWTPTSSPAPVLLMGHPGGLRTMCPRLGGRARHSAANGFAAATIELPGAGGRPPSADAEQARADLALPGISGPVGYSGGVTALGIRLALVEPRIAALGLFAGTFVPRVMFDEARQITVPLHVLLQWDDEGNDRQRALDLFDAFGSQEKTLQANMGGHTGVPPFAADDAAKFFARHLR